MPVVRGPDGKFQSVTDAGYDVDETAVFSGSMEYIIAAADITTGKDQFDVTGEAAEIIDFTDYLDADDTFLCNRAEVFVQIAPERTATAEHIAQVEYQVRKESGLELTTLNEGNDIRDTGSVSTDRHHSDEDDIIVVGTVAGNGDFADSAAGLAAGGAMNQAQHVVNYPGAGLPPRQFDEDDEVFIPTRILLDGSDDQGFVLRYAVTLHGTTVDR